ncbi:MAG: Flp family type IVb pilin [Candidatus Dormibacteraeota bacterium]|nr:Flp family type IVb pilin [Candidatus Dormibacteraeota bacterium]
MKKETRRHRLLSVVFVPRKVHRNQRGQGLVEYGLILILVAIVVIVILSVVGAQTQNVFSNVSNGLAR